MMHQHNGNALVNDCHLIDHVMQGYHEMYTSYLRGMMMSSIDVRQSDLGAQLEGTIDRHVETIEGDDN